MKELIQIFCAYAQLFCIYALRRYPKAVWFRLEAVHRHVVLDWDDA